jgi:hypothetical protein
MPGFLQRLLQLFGGATAAIAAEAIRFVRAKVRAWRLGLAEQIVARLNALAMSYASSAFRNLFFFSDFPFSDFQRVIALVGGRNPVPIGQLVLLSARALALHFAARVVERQVSNLVIILIKS